MIDVFRLLGGADNVERIGRELYAIAARDPLIQPAFAGYSQDMVDHIRTMLFATLDSDDQRTNLTYVRIAHRDIVTRGLLTEEVMDRLAAIFDRVMEAHSVPKDNRDAVLQHMLSYKDAALNR